ncbi:hypothetical protein GCM10027342_51200 [Photobacterium alginatilyticum]
MLGKAQLAGGTEKQLGIKVFLKLADPPAYIGSGKIQRVCRGAKATELNDGCEEFEIVETHNKIA